MPLHSRIHILGICWCLAVGTIMHAQVYHTDVLDRCVQISNDTAQVFIYHHIPYAKAERFQNPELVAFDSSASWIQRGPICPQWAMDTTQWGDRGENEQSEQCLVLTVNTPYPLEQVNTDTKLLPVLVHIHGGAYLFGGGEQCQNDLWELALRGKIVTVTLTHRLGVFGYYYEPKEGILNMGHADLLVALEWVNKYIGQFGGDNRHITLSGQSAGAQSVAYLLADSNRIALEQAILFSAPLGVLLQPGEAKNRSRKMVRLLQGQDMHSCSADSLLAAQKAYHRHHRMQIMPFAPVGLSVKPNSTVQYPKRILVSVQKQDAAMFVDKWLWKMGTDVAFLNPAKKYVKQWQKVGVDARLIILDWEPQGSPLGACHAAELPLFTGTPDNWLGTWFMGNVSYEDLMPVRLAFEDRLIRFIYGREW